MEMFEGHLQVVAGLLEKLIERLADENAQGKSQSTISFRQTLLRVEKMMLTAANSLHFEQMRSM